MNRKAVIFAVLLILLLAPAAAAWSWNPATWVSRAFKIGDAKDIDLNQNSIGNGNAWNLTCQGNCTNFNGTTGATGATGATETNASNFTTGMLADARLTGNVSIYLTPEFYGAIGDNITDDTAAIQAAANICGAGNTNRKVLKLSDKTYKISSVIKVNCSISGNNPETSRIYNSGTGDALDLSGAGYYSVFENFGVVGTSASRDGIITYNETSKFGNVAYSTFENVWSTYNGRHGFYFNQSWGTKAYNIKAHYNNGVGIYIAGSSANGMKFTDSESRWNGGTGTNTYSTDKGGVKIVSAASVVFDGGVYESNNAWAFIVNGTTNAKRQITIRNIYAENNPRSDSSTLTGGFIVLDSSGSWDMVRVQDSYISYGAKIGSTGYGFYILSNGEAGNNFQEDGNVLIGSGAGTLIPYSNVYRELPIMSAVIGDYGAAGAGVNTSILTASPQGTWLLYGLVTAKRTGVAGTGIYMFTASYDSEGYSINMTGTSGIESAQGRPTMSWVGTNLYLNYSAYNYGYVTLLSGIEDSKPTTYTVNTAVFKGNNRRSHY